ncbi:hypothetical protein [Actinoplanes sp. NPDC049265]|uniref:hypothetical protein n=1 Tax=Actinoplanes sp. NPDC049265 TaxID=3363902 RepID=UPI00371B8DD7
MTSLTATRPSFWKNDYELAVDGRVVTRWNAKFWRAGGSFELDGRTYEVRTNAWATRYEMTDQPTGVLMATAERVGRKRWTITADGRTYAFQRGSVWRLEQLLILDGHPAGSIRRPYLRPGTAEADLPGLPPHVQIFAFLVVLSGWDQASAAAG